MNFARELWQRIETTHAVTYFGSETVDAGQSLGLSGFWMGYFGFRAAPMGAVGGAVVEATFFNFAPSFVRRWVPDVWSTAAPDALIAARRAAAVATLHRLYPDVAAVAEAVNPTLEAAVGRGITAGRPLFAANRVLELPNEPVERLWQLCTSLREHRGDGHVAALTAAGLDGLDAHVLIAAEQGSSPEDLQRSRGWTAADWSEAIARRAARGQIDRSGQLTDAGRGIRVAIEKRTDELAAAPFDTLTHVERTALIDTLDPLARAISASGTIRYPNPMGLPPLVAHPSV